MSEAWISEENMFPSKVLAKAKPNKMHKITGYIKLIRPPLLVLGFLASYALMRYYGNWGGMKGWLILLAIGFGNTSFNVLNEIADVKQDCINKPWKPLPSGQVSIDGAFMLSVWCFIISAACIAFLGILYDMMYVVLGILGYLFGGIYNLTQRGIGGNIALALTYGIAAYISSYPHGLLFATAFGITTMAFNIAVQIQDHEADRMAGVITIPYQVGVEKARMISYCLAVCAIPFYAVLNLPLTKLAFTLICGAVMAAVLIDSDRSYELLVRVLARALMIAGFVFMLMGW